MHLSASLTARLSELVRVTTCPVVPSIETLFDVIQVCEISLSLVSRHQFDAWVRGPLNSLIPHCGLLVWTHGLSGASEDMELLEVGSGWSGLATRARIDTTRFALMARRRWLAADRTPLLLNASCEGIDWLSQFPDGGQIVIHGVDLLLGREKSLFALVCDSTQVVANAFVMTQLIAPYLQLAVQRIRGGADEFTSRPPVTSVPVSTLRLSARQIEILEGIRDGKSNAEIGASLYISPHTVKSHLQRTFRKLEVSTRTQAVAMALALKLLDHRSQRLAVT